MERASRDPRACGRTLLRPARHRVHGRPCNPRPSSIRVARSALIALSSASSTRRPDAGAEVDPAPVSGNRRLDHRGWIARRRIGQTKSGQQSQRSHRTDEICAKAGCPELLQVRPRTACRSAGSRAPCGQLQPRSRHRDAAGLAGAHRHRTPQVTGEPAAAAVSISAIAWEASLSITARPAEAGSRQARRARSGGRRRAERYPRRGSGHRRHRAAGAGADASKPRRAVKIEPRPGLLSTVTSPPMASASRREMTRPSPVPPRRCEISIVGLPELGEQTLDRLCRKPDAGILDADGDARPRRRPPLARDADQQAAAVGELHRVADQVEHDLANARLVADDVRRQARIDRPGDIQALLVRRWREQFDGRSGRSCPARTAPWRATSLPASILEKSRISSISSAACGADWSIGSR